MAGSGGQVHKPRGERIGLLRGELFHRAIDVVYRPDARERVGGHTRDVPGRESSLFALAATLTSTPE